MTSSSLLTLDVGLTTGYALYRGDILVEAGSIGDQNLDEALKVLRAKTHGNGTVIAERTVAPPNSGLGRRLNEIERLVVGAFPHVQWISAHDWKPSPARRYQVPKTYGKHTKDAIRMAVWWRKYR